MSSTALDYDSVAEICDLYVKADYDIPFFLRETASVAGRVLELTAGTGRLSLPLLEAGVQLTCVDRSRGMLDVLSMIRLNSFHSIRHTAITAVCRMSKELSLAQRCARHVSPLTTTLYTQPSDEEMFQRVPWLSC